MIVVLIVVVLTINVAGVVGIVLIVMTVTCTAIICFTAINVFIMVLVVVMRDVATVVALVIVTITLVESVTTVTAVFGRTVDVIIDVIIVIVSVIIVSVINVSATVVFVSAVNRKKKFGRRRTIRLTASSRRTTSPINFSRRANFGLKPVAPAQKAGRNGDLARILMSEFHTVFVRCAGVVPKRGCPQWMHKCVK